MAKLTAADRRMIPKGEFAIPAKAPGPGSYPMPDRKHAGIAKSMAAQHASPAVEAKVDAKANKMLGETKAPAMGKRHGSLHPDMKYR